MIKKAITFLLFSSIIFTSCEKPSDRELTTQEKILGKWKVNTIVEEESIGGIPKITTYQGKPNDYVDFREDGKVYYNTFGSLDTFTFRIVNDQLLVQDVVDSFQIVTLTSTNFTQYHHISGSTYKYTENLYK